MRKSMIWIQKFKLGLELWVRAMTTNSWIFFQLLQSAIILFLLIDSNYRILFSIICYSLMMSEKIQ